MARRRHATLALAVCAIAGFGAVAVTLTADGPAEAPASVIAEAVPAEAPVPDPAPIDSAEPEAPAARAPLITPVPVAPTTLVPETPPTLEPIVTATDAPAPAPDEVPTAVPATPRPKPKPRVVPRVATTLTVFPPAVRISVDGNPAAAGHPIALEPGTHTVTLVHPGCEACGSETYRLDIPSDGTRELRRHFTFTRQPDLAPASLLVTCGAGGWVETAAGTRYPCNVEHALPVTSERPSLLTLTAFDAEGKRLETRRFTIRPKAPIVWRL